MKERRTMVLCKDKANYFQIQSCRCTYVINMARAIISFFKEIRIQIIMGLVLTVSIIFICVRETVFKFDANKDVIFKLFEANHLTEFSVLNPHDSKSVPDSFDPQFPTRIYIHGYLTAPRSINRFRQTFFHTGTFNFVGVDWTKGASNINFLVSKSRIKPVSRRRNDRNISRNNGLYFKIEGC